MSTTTVEFSLGSFVREVAESSDSNDPRAIATEVIGKLGPDEIVAALGQSLPHYVRIVLDRDRAASRVPPPETQEGAPGSAKWDAVASLYPRILAARVSVRGEWKRMADCSADDCRAVAAERREMAARTAAEGARFERYAEALRKRRAKRIGDLPQAVVLEIARSQP